MANEHLDLLRQIRDQVLLVRSDLVHSVDLLPDITRTKVQVRMLEVDPARTKELLAPYKEAVETAGKLKKHAEAISAELKTASGKVFDAPTARRLPTDAGRGPRVADSLFEGLMLTQIRRMFQNLTAELSKTFSKIVPQIGTGILGRLLEGTILNTGQAGSGGKGGLFGNLFKGLLGGVLTGGLSALAAGLAGLIGRKPAAASLLVPFQPPRALSLQIANTDRILAGFPRFDFSASGDRRLMESALGADGPREAPRPPRRPESPPINITVNVNAIDSRSFRDHAPAIAEAVRDAMLHMHPINHLIRDSS